MATVIPDVLFRSFYRRPPGAFRRAATCRFPLDHLPEDARPPWGNGKGEYFAPALPG